VILPWRTELPRSTHGAVDNDRTRTVSEYVNDVVDLALVRVERSPAAGVPGRDGATLLATKGLTPTQHSQEIGTPTPTRRVSSTNVV
jgi:hypothetical protein